jgi:hypothetical protein
MVANLQRCQNTKSNKGFFKKGEQMAKPESEPTRPARDAIETVIGGKRISEMTADELIKAMKQIAIELERRNQKTK